MAWNFRNSIRQHTVHTTGPPKQHLTHRLALNPLLYSTRLYQKSYNLDVNAGYSQWRKPRQKQEDSNFLYNKGMKSQLGNATPVSATRWALLAFEIEKSYGRLLVSPAHVRSPTQAKMRQERFVSASLRKSWTYTMSWTNTITLQINFKRTSLSLSAWQNTGMGANLIRDPLPASWPLEM